MTDFWTDAEVISTYTRAQAIEDGVLVDVTTVAAEAGFRWPVAMTRAAWVEFVEWQGQHAAIQDESGRLWDVVWMASWAGRRTQGDTVRFEVLRVPNTPRSTVPRIGRLKMVVGPGDTPEPVVTIMLPDED